LSCVSAGGCFRANESARAMRDFPVRATRRGVIAGPERGLGPCRGCHEASKALRAARDRDRQALPSGEFSSRREMIRFQDDGRRYPVLLRDGGQGFTLAGRVNNPVPFLSSGIFAYLSLNIFVEPTGIRSSYPFKPGGVHHWTSSGFRSLMSSGSARHILQARPDRHSHRPVPSRTPAASRV